ncbi:hypothetical protein HDU91_005841 [Kappamyces sp. JEL0680]|nr:hypothetical protein HDU91_005841 [Kappamyces sp. JEL0680]
MADQGGKEATIEQISQSLAKAQTEFQKLSESSKGRRAEFEFRLQNEEPTKVLKDQSLRIQQLEQVIEQGNAKVELLK